MNPAQGGQSNRTAIVLAAGDVPTSLRPFVGRTCAAMLPVNGRPIIHWSLQYLREQGIRRVIVGVRSTETRLPRFLKQTFGSQLNSSSRPSPRTAGQASRCSRAYANWRPAKPVSWCSVTRCSSSPRR